MNELGIYIHIPFCVKKCAYCDFYSIEDVDKTAAYTNALVEQIRSFRQAARGRTVDTVYFGGGTPSVLSGAELTRIMDAVKSTFHLSEDAEVTMEANPGTLDAAKLAMYHAAGVNRLSIGLQSADNEELQLLSRIHTREQFEESFLLARMEGFENISVDVMYALPNQTEARLSATLDYVLTMAPEHISFYGLKIEPNTPFGKMPHIERTLPSEDLQYKMYLDAAKRLEDAGYLQYEISNFAKPGTECRHNLKYWELQEYLGFGPAAHSFFRGRMFSYTKNAELFLAMPDQSGALLDEDSAPSQSELAAEYVMLGFRLRRGVDVEKYEKRFHDDFELRYHEKMRPFLEKKYILQTTTGYRLSKRGMLISNYILSEILDF